MDIFKEEIEEEKWIEFHETDKTRWYVSNLGNVLSVTKSNGNETLINTMAINPKSKIFDRGKGLLSGPFEGKRRVHVARLVAHFFVPNPENKTFVAYYNNDSLDCRAANLYWSNDSTKARRVFYINYEGVILEEFKSVTDACIFWNKGNDTNTPNLSHTVHRCLLHKHILSSGNTFIYESDYLSRPIEDILKERVKQKRKARVKIPATMKTANFVSKKNNITYNNVFNIRIADNPDSDLIEMFEVKGHRQIIQEIKSVRCYKWAK